MHELLISEITRMAEGFCVIGLEHHLGGFHSIRPIPRKRFAWQPFPYRRGDRVTFDLFLAPLVRPHLEDREAGNHSRRGSVSEDELVECLRHAEVAGTVSALFDCPLRHSPYGGPAVCAQPAEASRSVCGCEIQNISFSLKYYPQSNVRVTLLLKSGERLDSLPLVDHDWLRFVDHLWEQGQGSANLGQRLQRFFNWQTREHILSSPAPFARIGLTRPERDGLCWLMLDSVFPLPRKKWLEDFR